MRALFLVAFSMTLGIRAGSGSVVEEMTWAANNLLKTLSPEERQAATFDFKGDERKNWHFIPKKRRGLALTDMSSEQRALAHGLLSTALSHQGQLKAVTIMSLEKILQRMEGPNRRFPRDPALYHISIFGKPAKDTTWGWRIEGHHISLNFTIVKGEVASVTPSFFGSNPARVPSGPRRGLEVLAAEQNLGRELVQSLNDDQLKKAWVNKKAPRDIFTGAKREVTPLNHDGLSAREMTWHQRELLTDLIETYIHRYRAELAEIDLEKIDHAGIENIQFAWMGGLEPGEAHYYSIQGPTFLMEYDNIQNNANHIHAVWRDFKNDFGEDLLRRHYAQFPH